jgi:endoglucanase
MCSCSLDDKIAVFLVASLYKALYEELKSHGTYIPEDHWSKKYTVIFLSATQEETGLRGATVAAKNINPDISIDCDVDFAANDELSGPKEKIGDIKLGEGPIIAYGADKSIRLNKALKESAPEKYQTVSTGCGGTNTDTIQLSSADCETAHVAIPNFSMHSPVEICDWRDVQGAAEMIYNVIVNRKA